MRVNIQFKETGDTAAQVGRMRTRIPKIVQQIVLREANLLRREIVLGIRNGAPGGRKFKPLAKSTKKMKKSSKPLIHHGDLIRSVRVHNESGGVVFVGVHRTAMTKDGAHLMNIAEIHEFGTRPYLIPVTAKMRRWWFAMFRAKVFKRPLKAWTLLIDHPGVPARPFLRPSFNAWAKGVEVRVQEAFVKQVKGAEVGGTISVNQGGAV